MNEIFSKLMIPFTGFLLLFNASVLAEQFNQTGWAFKQNITGNFLTPIDDYELRLNVTFDSNMQSDFDDLRFTDVNNEELPFFIDKKSDSGFAEVFVKGNYTTSGTQLIMFFGNPNVNTVSNGFNTFALFDDFEGASINDSIWDSLGGGFQKVENGKLVLAKLGSGSSGIISKKNFTDGFIFEANGSILNPVDKNTFGFSTALGYSACRVEPNTACFDSTTDFGVPKWHAVSRRDSNETFFNFGSLSDFQDIFFDWRIARNDTNNSVIYSFGSNNVTFTTNVPNSSLNIYFFASSNTGDHSTQFEEVKIRKLVSSEPIATFGLVEPIEMPPPTLPPLNVKLSGEISFDKQLTGKSTEQIKLIAFVRNSVGTPVSGANVNITILKPNGTCCMVTIDSNPITVDNITMNETIIPGVYEFTSLRNRTLPPDGVYIAYVKAFASESIGEDSIVFRIDPINSSLLNTQNIIFVGIIIVIALIWNFHISKNFNKMI